MYETGVVEGRGCDREEEELEARKRRPTERVRAVSVRLAFQLPHCYQKFCTSILLHFHTRSNCIVSLQDSSLERLITTA